MSGYIDQGAEGLAILLWAAEPQAPHRLATPFFHALAALALEAQVEIYFSAASVHLLRPGVADGLVAAPDAPRSIGALMRQAHAAGARLFVCSDAIVAQGLAGLPLVPECSGHGGAVQFAARALDPRWRTLVF
jgi:uncharacterized protein